MGMTQDDVQLALGAPHYVATSDGTTTWLYYYEPPDAPRPLPRFGMTGDFVEDSLKIDFGIDDRVAKVTDFALRR